MHQPFVSIIITILNGEKTIAQCLDSIKCQSFLDYEVVVVDGGSTDQTIAIINKDKIINKQVHVVPGLGLYAGLNFGIKVSKGKWLYFLGCDDELYSTDTLQKVSDVIKKDTTNTEVFVGNVQCVKQENLLRAKFGSLYLMRYQVHHQGMFYDREVFNNLMYDENRRIISDYELNLKLAINDVPHKYMDIIVCNFGGDGISENQAKHGFSEMQDVHRQLFSGLTRKWVVNYCSTQYHISLIRKRLNLINLKVRFKKFVKIQI